MNPSCSKPLAQLAELSARHPDLGPLLTRELALRARRFMNGVTLYRNHPASRDADDAPIIWRQGSTCLRDYTQQAAPAAPVIFAVPSLINRFTILDLHPRHSLLRFLAACGFRVLVVDWGDPGDDERDFALGDYVTRRLVPALRHGAGARPAHVLGYCMGGLLALALARLCPVNVRSLSLLATPWDFHAGAAPGQAGLEEKLQSWLAADDPLPVDVIQGLFAALQPMQAMHKFSNFSALDQSGFDAERFVLTEDWLNDGMALTASAARDCFGDFCSRNITGQGLWQVGGLPVDPRAIDAPCYVVIPERDRIVPPESALALARLLPNVTRAQPHLGHIGIMASARAPVQVWTPLAQWLAAN